MVTFATSGPINLNVNQPHTTSHNYKYTHSSLNIFFSSSLLPLLLISPAMSQPDYYQQPPQSYQNQTQNPNPNSNPEYYQPYQQQPQMVYVQQQPEQTSNNNDCLLSCLGSICICLSVNLLLNLCI